MMKKNYWFTVKRYGYGATPCTWQGWVVLLFFLLLLMGMAILFSENTVLFAFASVVLVFMIIFISKYMSDDVWKWRWGGK
jgi:hypothetical protein